MMTQAQADRILAMVLRIGAYGSFLLLMSAAVWSVASPQHSQWLARAGVLFLIATPGMRIIAAVVTFWMEGDKRYALVSLTVLMIVAVSSFLGLEH